jgi:uncharacterized protein (TIGR02246 family)
MHSDEGQIRELVASWMAATKSGDVDTVLNLIADDVVFLIPGRAPMRKDEFAEASKRQAKPGGPKIEGISDIQEIRVLGSWAFMWSKLAVTVTPEGSPPVARAGHMLTVFKKETGKWVIARDANLLSPV